MKREETERDDNAEYGNHRQANLAKVRGIASSRLILVVTQQPDSAARSGHRTEKAPMEGSQTHLAINEVIGQGRAGCRTRASSSETREIALRQQLRQARRTKFRRGPRSYRSRCTARLPGTSQSSSS